MAIEVVGQRWAAPHSGGNASASASWARRLADDRRLGLGLADREDSGVPTLPATATGSTASPDVARSSLTVVLPFVPVRLEAVREQPPGELDSPRTGSPRSRAAIAGALSGTPGS